VNSLTRLKIDKDQIYHVYLERQRESSQQTICIDLSLIVKLNSRLINIVSKDYFILRDYKGRQANKTKKSIIQNKKKVPTNKVELIKSYKQSSMVWQLIDITYIN